MLIDWSYFYYRRIESTGDNYGFPLKMVTFDAALQIMGFTTHTKSCLCQVVFTSKKTATFCLSYLSSPICRSTRSSWCKERQFHALTRTVCYRLNLRQSPGVDATSTTLRYIAQLKVGDGLLGLESTCLTLGCHSQGRRVVSLAPRPDVWPVAGRHMAVVFQACPENAVLNDHVPIHVKGGVLNFTFATVKIR